MFVTFVVAWVPSMSTGVVEWLGCNGTFVKPWTFLTYPFATTGSGAGIIFDALQWFWLFWIGSSIEKSDGWKGLLLSFFGYTLLAGLLTAACGRLTGPPVLLVGPWLPISALTCVWAGRNPAAIIRLMMVIPVNGKILAVVTAATDLFIYGAGAPFIGVLAALACVVGWFHGTGAILARREKPVVSGRGQRAQNPKEFDQFMTQVRAREKEREERERLRRLLEGGPSDGPPGADD